MKTVRGKHYLHKSCLPTSPPQISKKVKEALRYIPRGFEWNIVRVEQAKVSFLSYRNFWREPHPTLVNSSIVDLIGRRAKQYAASKRNPPILHRKETMIDPRSHHFEEFRNLTIEEENAGLLESSRKVFIGTKKNWEELLRTRNMCIRNHRLITRDD